MFGVANIHYSFAEYAVCIIFSFINFSAKPVSILHWLRSGDRALERHSDMSNATQIMRGKADFSPYQEYSKEFSLSHVSYGKMLYLFQNYFHWNRELMDAVSSSQWEYL